MEESTPASAAGEGNAGAAVAPGVPAVAAGAAAVAEGAAPPSAGLVAGISTVVVIAPVGAGV
jgi:hypothetical protein